MSDWHIPSVPELERPAAPPLWIPVVALFVALTVGIIVTVLNWEVGRSIITAPFVKRALIAPTLFWGMLCALYYSPHEDHIECVTWWNYLCRNRFAHWRGWSKWNLAIIDSVILTPEADLAERMLGLDGTPPDNAGQTRALEGNPADPARVEQLLETLITPLYPQLKRLTGSEAVRVVLTAPSDAYLKPLLAVLRRTKMPWLHPDNLSFAQTGEEAALIEKWLDMSEANYSRGEWKPGFEASLLVALQVHEPDITPMFSEAGVALFFTSHQFARTHKLKPRARLFRPATAALDELPDRLHAVFTAAPTPIEKLKHVWTSGLSKLARNNVNGTLDDVERELERHDVDAASGLPGPASTWLAQALAAQMVAYGQGPQLVIAPAGQDVMLNLLGVHYAPVPQANEPPLNIMPLAQAFGVICCGCFALCLMEMGEFSPSWFWSVLAVTLALCLIGVPVMAIFGRRCTSEDFYEAARH